MKNVDIWVKVRKKMKSGVRNKFTEIRKLIGYKNEESIAEVLGLTRQTLSKFGTYQDAYEDNTHNTLLLSIIALMDNFLYENRFDFDNIEKYRNELDEYFFSEIRKDDELRPLYYYEELEILYINLYESNIESRYISLWLDTFKNEKLSSEKEKVDINYRKPTIRQIVSNYHIYILSDFLLEDNAEKFLYKLFPILWKQRKKVKISNFTIDVIQQSRLSCKDNIYENSLIALELIQIFEEKKVSQRMKSNPNIEDEVGLVKSEIRKLDNKNAIVFTQNNIENIFEINNYGYESILNSDFKLLCLKLNRDEEINIDDQIGYEICDRSSYYLER